MADSKPIAVLGNFDEPDAVMHCASKVHHAGYRDFDIYTPYPIHGLDKAMGAPRTPLTKFSLGGAVFGLANALFLLYFTGVIHYPLNIGGKPLFSVWFGMPIIFELAILLTGLTTAIVMFGLLCRLPQWHHPLQKDEGFRRAVDDKHVVAIEAKDPRFTVEGAQSILREAGAHDIRIVEA